MRNAYKRNHYLLETVGRIQSIDLLAIDQQAPESAIGLVGSMKVLLPLGSLIDKTEELARLNREITKFQKDLDKVDSKLQNASFVERAPKEVVEKEQLRAKELAVFNRSIASTTRKGRATALVVF